MLGGEFEERNKERLDNYPRQWQISDWDGRRVSFWKDVWCGEEALGRSFPTLFNMVVNKDALVRDVWDSSRERGGWIPCFDRSFNDWELREVENFLHAIQPLKVFASREGKLI